jgi:hypothetical protein
VLSLRGAAAIVLRIVCDVTVPVPRSATPPIDWAGCSAIGIDNRRGMPTELLDAVP